MAWPVITSATRIGNDIHGWKTLLSLSEVPPGQGLTQARRCEVILSLAKEKSLARKIFETTRLLDSRQFPEGLEAMKKKTLSWIARG